MRMLVRKHPLEDYDNKYNPKGPRLKDAVDDLKTRWPAPEGKQRLEIVAENFINLSVEQTYRLLNPEAYRREVEEIKAYERKNIHYWRVALGLAPLIVTWGSLSWAVLAYGNYAVQHSHDKQPLLPFLQLWEQGSLGGIPFFWTGVIDVILLLGFLFLNLYALRREYIARRESGDFAKELQAVTDGLMEAVAREGRKDVASNAEIQRVVKYIREAIAESYTDLGQVVDNAKDSIIKTGDELKDLYASQIVPMFTSFDANVQLLHNDLQTLNGYIQTLADASTHMTTAAGNMASSAASMAGSASSMAGTVSVLAGICQAMDNHLAQLNNTEQAMTHTIAQKQDEVVLEIRKMTDEVTQSAQDMRSAAKNVESVGKMITPQNIQQLTDNAMAFTMHAGQVANELQSVIKRLQGNSPARWKWWPF